MKNNFLILGVVPDKWYGKGDKKNCNLNEILNKLEKEDSKINGVSLDRIYEGMKGILKVGKDNRNCKKNVQKLERGIYATFEVININRDEERINFKVIDNFFAENKIISDTDAIVVLGEEKFTVMKKSADIITLSEYEKINNIFRKQLSTERHTIKKEPKTEKIERYVRSKSVHDEVLRRANFKCELDATHISFISDVTNKNYMETHHLIQLKEYKNNFKGTDTNLDIVPNSICLCPNCHRRIHYGKKEDVIKLLEILFTARKDSLNKCLLEPITFELLKELYFPTIR